MLGITGWWAWRGKLHFRQSVSSTWARGGQLWQGLRWHMNDSICVPRCVLEVAHGLVLCCVPLSLLWPHCWCWQVCGQHLGLCFTWWFHCVSAHLVLSRTYGCRNQWCESFREQEKDPCVVIHPLLWSSSSFSLASLSGSQFWWLVAEKWALQVLVGRCCCSLVASLFE